MEMGKINCRDTPATAPIIFKKIANRGIEYAQEQINKLMQILKKILLPFRELTYFFPLINSVKQLFSKG